MPGNMRPPRFLAPPEAELAYYHCISRTINAERIFQDEDLEVMREVFRSQAAFCGIEIVTFCLLSNHFHILVGVPKRPEGRLPEEAFFTRLGALYSRGRVRELHRQWKELPEEQRPAWEERFLVRMWNLSTFMKEAKGRFTQWYNQKRGWDGPRWKTRFHSVLVGTDGGALATMAAYIDLNPVRARVVEDPKDYRWSGYGEAMAGNRQARGAYGAVMELAEGQPREDAFEAYRMWLYQSGEQRGIEDPQGLEAVRKGIDPERVKEVLASKGRIGWMEALNCRRRYLCETMAFGTGAFLGETFGRSQGQPGHPPRRRPYPLKLPGLEAFYALKALRRTRAEMMAAAQTAAA